MALYGPLCSTETIRALGRRVAGDIVEIGTRLIAVKERVGHGNWLPWLDSEFGWSDNTAQRFMAVASAFGKFATLGNLGTFQIDASALYLLAAPEMPEAARDQAATEAAGGEMALPSEAVRESGPIRLTVRLGRRLEGLGQARPLYPAGPLADVSRRQWAMLVTQRAAGERTGGRRKARRLPALAYSALMPIADVLPRSSSCSS